MKTINDFIDTLQESEGATNVVGDGQGDVKLRQTPIGLAKRAKNPDVGHPQHQPNPVADNEVPLSNVYPADQKVTDDSATDDEKKKFKQKQQHQDDQSIGR